MLSDDSLSAPHCWREGISKPGDWHGNRSETYEFPQNTNELSLHGGEI